MSDSPPGSLVPRPHPCEEGDLGMRLYTWGRRVWFKVTICSNLPSFIKLFFRNMFLEREITKQYMIKTLFIYVMWAVMSIFTNCSKLIVKQSALWNITIKVKRVRRYLVLRSRWSILLSWMYRTAVVSWMNQSRMSDSSNVRPASRH